MKLAARAWNGLLIGLTTLFVINVGLMIAVEITDIETSSAKASGGIIHYRLESSIAIA